jgi:hypothetical protein
VAGYVYRGPQRGLTAEEQAEDLIEREQRRCATCGYLARSLGHRVQCKDPRTVPPALPGGPVRPEGPG